MQKRKVPFGKRYEMQLKDIQNLKRFKDIVMAFLQHGFDVVVDHLEVPWSALLLQVPTTLACGCSVGEDW